MLDNPSVRRLGYFGVGVVGDDLVVEFGMSFFKSASCSGPDRTWPAAVVRNARPRSGDFVGLSLPAAGMRTFLFAPDREPVMWRARVDVDAAYVDAACG